MTAAKHTDPIVGLDMHLVVPPMGPPMMVPIPVAGMVMDPADYQPGACTVFINGLPRARAGNACLLAPPHVPVGGSFLKPPTNEAELYQGSSTVIADGEALSAIHHQVLGCHDVGSPAPTRAWKSGGAKSLMTAGSVVLPIPGGPPVNVGGAPTVAARGRGAGEVESEASEPMARFVVVFRRNGVERRNEPLEAEVDGTPLTEVTSTDDRGRLAVEVPLRARELVVVFAKGTAKEQTYRFGLHRLEPATTEKGVEQRLANLGYPVDTDRSAAIAAFQATQGLSPTGEVDELTARRAKEVHGV